MAVIDLETGEQSDFEEGQIAFTPSEQPDVEQFGRVIDLETGEFVIDGEEPVVEEELIRGTSGPEQFTGGLEVLQTLLTGSASEVLGGLAGITRTLSPFAEEGAGTRVIEEARKFTSIPTTEAGIAQLKSIGEALSGPAKAFGEIEQASAESQAGLARGLGFGEKTQAAFSSVGKAIPTAIIELIGVGLGKRFIKLAETAAESAQKTATAIKDVQSGKVTEGGAEEIAGILQKGTPDEVAQVIDADPEFFRAADELGISTEPVAGFLSNNPQFRDVSAALQKIPGSPLEPQAIKFIEATSQSADNLIQQYGGTLDKAQLGLDFKRESLLKVDQLFDQSDELYGSLKKLIPESNKFSAPETVAFLKERVKAIGGEAKLPAKLKRTLNNLKGRPTLGIIDHTRKEVGQAIGKGSGSFKDELTGINKALYARLTRDQDAIAETVDGGKNISDAAKAVTRQRKQIEDNLQLLLGKDLNDALNVNVAGAIKNLQKGEVDRFNEVMNAIPEHKRGEVAMSALNDVFKGAGVGQESLSPTQFTKWYQTIQRSPAVSKALFGALPPDSKRALDNLFKVSRGISRSLGQTTPTGRINAMFSKEGIFRRLIPKTIAAGLSKWTNSLAVYSATNTVMSYLLQKSNGAIKTATLLGAPEFQNFIRQSVKEGVVDGAQASRKLLEAESKLARSKQYKEWAKTLGKADRAALQGGLASYLFKQEEGQATRSIEE